MATSALQTVALDLPPGKLGIVILESPSGKCIVTGKSGDATPLLLVGDQIVMLNGLKLEDVEVQVGGKVRAWETLLALFGGDERRVVVRRAMPFTTLNDDAVLTIASFGAPEDMFNLALTCRRMGSTAPRQWSLVNEAARLIANETMTTSPLRLLPLRHGESWIGRYHFLRRREDARRAFDRMRRAGQGAVMDAPLDPNPNGRAGRGPVIVRRLVDGVPSNDEDNQRTYASLHQAKNSRCEFGIGRTTDDDQEITGARVREAPGGQLIIVRRGLSVEFAV